MSAKLPSPAAGFGLVDDPRRGDGVHVALLCDAAVVVAPRGGLQAAAAATGAAWVPVWQQGVQPGDMEAPEARSKAAGASTTVARLAASKLAVSAPPSDGDDAAPAHRVAGRSLYVASLQTALNMGRSRARREGVPDAVLAGAWSPPGVLGSAAPALAVATARGRVVFVGPPRVGGSSKSSSSSGGLSDNVEGACQWVVHPVAAVASSSSSGRGKRERDGRHKTSQRRDGGASDDPALQLPAPPTCCAWADASATRCCGSPACTGPRGGVLAVGTAEGVGLYLVSEADDEDEEAGSVAVKELLRIPAPPQVRGALPCAARVPTAVTWLDSNSDGADGSSAATSAKVQLLAVGFSDGSIEAHAVALLPSCSASPSSDEKDGEEDEEGLTALYVGMAPLTPHLTAPSGDAYAGDAAVTRLLWAPEQGTLAAVKGVALWLQQVDVSALTPFLMAAVVDAREADSSSSSSSSSSRSSSSSIPLTVSAYRTSSQRLVEDATTNVLAMLRPRWSTAVVGGGTIPGVGPAAGVRNAHDAVITGLTFWTSRVAALPLIGGFHRTENEARIAGAPTATYLVSCGVDGKVRAWSLAGFASLLDPPSAGTPAPLCRELYAGALPNTVIEATPRPLTPLSGLCLAATGTCIYTVSMRARPALFSSGHTPRDTDSDIVVIPLLPLPHFDLLALDAWVAPARVRALALQVLCEDALRRRRAALAGAPASEPLEGGDGAGASPDAAAAAAGVEASLTPAEVAALSSLLSTLDVPPILQPAAAAAAASSANSDEDEDNGGGAATGGAASSSSSAEADASQTTTSATAPLSLVTPSGRDDMHTGFLNRHRAALVSAVAACLAAAPPGARRLPAPAAASVVGALAADRVPPLCALDELCPALLDTGATALNAERAFLSQTVAACLRVAGGRAAVGQRVLDALLPGQRKWAPPCPGAPHFTPGGDRLEEVDATPTVPDTGAWWSLFAGVAHAVQTLQGSASAPAAAAAVHACLAPFTAPQDSRSSNAPLTFKPLFATLQATFPVALAVALQGYAAELPAAGAAAAGAPPAAAASLARLRALQLCVRLCDEVLRTQVATTSPDLAEAAAAAAKAGVALPASKEGAKKKRRSSSARPLALTASESDASTSLVKAQRRKKGKGAASSSSSGSSSSSDEDEGEEEKEEEEESGATAAVLAPKPPHALTMGGMTYSAINTVDATVLPPRWVWLAASLGPTLARWAIAEFSLLLLTGVAAQQRGGSVEEGDAAASTTAAAAAPSGLSDDDAAALRVALPWVDTALRAGTAARSAAASLPAWLAPPLRAALDAANQDAATRGSRFGTVATCLVCGARPAPAARGGAPASPAVAAARRLVCPPPELQYQSWWASQAASLTVPPRAALIAVRQALRLPAPAGPPLALTLQCTGGHLMSTCGASLGLLTDPVQILAGFGVTGTWMRVRSPQYTLPAHLPSGGGSGAAAPSPARGAAAGVDDDAAEELEGRPAKRPRLEADPAV